MPAKFTPADHEMVASYIKAKSKPLGNLHERMKWLVGCKEKLREHIASSADRRLKILFTNLATAILDIETEVSYTRPANPPFATRVHENDDSGSYPIYMHKKNGKSGSGE